MEAHPTAETTNADEREIRALIQSQFDSIRWGEGQEPDWMTVHKGFVLGGQLWPALRPARPQSSLDFADRLRKLRDDGKLRSFAERGVGCHVWIVGNMAVALAGCEMTENDGIVTHDVSGFLLVKDGNDGWRIAAQAWDYVQDIGAAFVAAGLSDEEPLVPPPDPR